jgi:hypothetical protein
LSVGAVLESICAAGSPTIISKTSSTVTLSAASTVTVATNGVFFPYGNGDGLTTFNIVDMRGYVPAGRCDMGGVDCSNLNSTYFSSNSSNTPSGLNAKGGSQSTTISDTNLPPYTPTGVNSGISLGLQWTVRGDVPGGGANNVVTSIVASGGSGSVTIPTANFSGNSFSGNAAPNRNNTPLSTVQPTLTLNYVVKVTPDINSTVASGVASIGGMTGVLICGANVTCSSNTISFNFAGVNSIQGMSGNITCGTGLSGSGNTINSSNTSIVQSRSDAAFLNLSSYNGIETLGYSKGGDGGGAKFYKYDSSILTFHIVNAGSCNNGTWPGIRLTGGTGKGATGTLIVVGGIATNFSLHGLAAQGNGYTVGDILTVSNAGNVVCATYPTIMVDSIGNGPFLDSSVTNFSVTNIGSGCTNGSYKGLTPQSTVINGGGYGDRMMINVDIIGGVVSGTSGAVPGNGYRVGDQLSFVNPNGTFQIPGCVVQPIIQITSISSPLGSFTDAGGKAFQIINDKTTNVLQFGAKSDYNWLQTKADATDNGPFMRAALQFTSVGSGPADARGYGGGTLYVPKGDYLVCGGLIIYEYTTFQGAGSGATTLHQCDTDGATASLIYQGSPTANVGNFYSNSWDMTLYGAITGTGPVIYSNNNQSGDAVTRIAIYANSTTRTCLKYEIGYGGQTMYGINNSYCVLATGSPAFDLSGNFGFSIGGQTQISSIGVVTNGFRFGDGGTAYVGPGVHCEGAVTNCISVNGSGSSPPLVTVQGITGPATNLIRIETGTPANYTTVINSASNGSACTVFMQATASCAKTGNQLGLATY